MIRTVTAWFARPVTDRRVALFLFLLMFGIYAALAGGHAYSSDEEGYFQQAYAFTDGTYAIAYGPDNQVVTAARGGRDGLTTGGAGIGAPLAGAPLVAVGRVVAQAFPDSQHGVVERLFAGFTNSWITALIAVFVFLAARELGARRPGALLLSLGFGLGTMALPHARTLLFSEPLAALGVTAAVYFAIRSARRGGWSDAIASGLAAGVSVLARPSCLPLAILVGAYVVWTSLLKPHLDRAGRDWRPLAGFALGGLAMGIVLAVGNIWRYGTWNDTGYGAAASSGVLGGSAWDGLAGLLFSPGKSIFLYAPLVLAAVIAIPWAMRRRPPEVLLLVALFLANLLLFARFPQWHGDQAWGPRYMHMVIPVIILVLAPVVDRLPWRRAVTALALVGVVISFLGVAMYSNQYMAFAEARLGTGPAPDGQPAYWGPVHTSPRWSPIVGHVRLLDDVASNSAARVDGRDTTFGSTGQFPTGTSARYGWYFAPPQWDSWWYWIFPQQTSKWLLLLLIPIGASVTAGAAGLRACGLPRGLR